MISSITQIGYLISTGFCLLFLVLLLSTWRGRLSGILLWVAILTSGLWSFSAFLVHRATDVLFFHLMFELFDAIRYFAWLYFLYDLLNPLQQKSNGVLIWLQHKYIWLSLPIILVLSKFIPGITHIWSQLTHAELHLTLLMLLSVFCLILTEQLYRHTKPQQRWAIKFLCLGLGTIFLFDFYLYSDAVLFNRIRTDTEAARGYLSLLYWPLIGIATARNPKWSVELFVSRTLAVRSIVVILAGVYLLLMSLIGYYLKHNIPDWGEVFILLFLFAATLFFSSLLFSGKFRGKVKFLVNKHFFNSQFDYRQEWLDFTQQLSQAKQQDTHFFKDVLKASAELMDSPGAMLWLQKSHGDFEFQDHWCMSPTEKDPHLGKLIPYLKDNQTIIDIEDYRKFPQNYPTLTMPKWLMQMPLCWAVLPLMVADTLQGVILLAKPHANRAINWEDRELLTTAALQLTSYIKLYQTTLDLVDAKQFEAFNRLSAFVVHDLKNVCAQLSLITTNATKHKDNPAFIDDAFSTVEHSVEKMQRMLASLRKNRVDAATTQTILLAPLLNELIQMRSTQNPQPLLQNCDSSITVRANHEKLVSVLNHLVQNAQDACQDDGNVHIQVLTQTEDIIISIKDNGCGMTDEFIRSRLFKPFDTTKGNSGMGIGAYQSKEVIESFGGKLSVTSEPNIGTEFLVQLSKAEAIPTPLEPSANN